MQILPREKISCYSCDFLWYWLEEPKNSWFLKETTKNTQIRTNTREKIPTKSTFRQRLLRVGGIFFACLLQLLGPFLRGWEGQARHRLAPLLGGVITRRGVAR